MYLEISLLMCNTKEKLVNQIGDIKKTKPPIHEFKVLQNVFFKAIKVKKQGLKCLLM